MKRSIYDTTINPDRLDIEQVANVQMIRYWNKQIAILTKDRDTIKHHIKVHESKKRMSLEKNPNNFDLSKYTDKLADSAIYADKKYQALQESLLEANFQLSKAYGYKESFTERSKALDNLVKMYLSSYYAENYRRKEVEQKDSSQQSASDMLEGALKNRKKKKVEE